MKKIIFASALLASTGLYANSIYHGFAGSPDLYHGDDSSSSLPTAVQPGIGDSYGSILLKGGLAETGRNVDHQGYADGYGSILIDLGHEIDW